MKKILVSLFLLVFGLCLVGCVDTPNGPGTQDPFLNDAHKLTVIDDFGYLVKPLDKYYKAGEEVEVHLAFLSGPSVGININGEYIGENAETKHVDGHPVITFIMSDKDSILYTTCNGYILKDCGEDNHQWDEGREIEGGNGGYVMKYICELCGKFKEETITIIPPQDCPFEYSINVEGHSKIMLCDCCDAPAIVKPHNDLDKNQTCDECGYVFDTIGINGMYTPELLASLDVLKAIEKGNEILEDFSLWIQSDILYINSSIFANGKIGEFTLGERRKLSDEYSLDELDYANDEAKDLVKDLFEQESYYAITIYSYPESVPGHYLIELNDDLYYVYTLFKLGVNGSRDTVLVYKLNK